MKLRTKQNIESGGGPALFVRSSTLSQMENPSRMPRKKKVFVHAYMYKHEWSLACTCMYVCMYVCMYICWQLLSNQNFKGPYLKAEVVEEVMGWQ